MEHQLLAQCIHINFVQKFMSILVKEPTFSILHSHFLKYHSSNYLFFYTIFIKILIFFSLFLHITTIIHFLPNFIIGIYKEMIKKTKCKVNSVSIKL